MQFDVYANNGRLAKEIPFVLDIQSDLLSEVLPSTVVGPLYSAKEVIAPVVKLHIPATVRRRRVIEVFNELSSVLQNTFGRKICNLEEPHGDAFRTALDVLFFNYP